MPMPDSNEVDSLVREALDALAKIDFDRYMDLWHEDCRVEYPTHLPGIPEEIVGKESLRKHNHRAFHGIDYREIRDLEIRPLEDSRFSVVEFEMEQSFGGGAGSFKGRVCVIFGAREGKLLSMREYMDSRLLVEAIAKYDETVAHSHG